MALTLRQLRQERVSKPNIPGPPIKSWVGHHDKKEHLHSLAHDVISASENVDYWDNGIGQIITGLNHPDSVSAPAAAAAQAHLKLSQYVSYLTSEIGLDFYMVRAESNFILTGEQLDRVFT